MPVQNSESQEMVKLSALEGMDMDNGNFYFWTYNNIGSNLIKGIFLFQLLENVWSYFKEN